jgi:hypothetical protein
MPASAGCTRSFPADCAPTEGNALAASMFLASRQESDLHSSQRAPGDHRNTRNDPE